MWNNGAFYVIGIDLGVRSLGFAVLELDKESNPTAIVRCGVRCFEAGVEGGVEQGKDESRAAKRRGPRLTRRQLWRRARRRRKIIRILQRHSVLPEGDTSTPEAIHNLIASVDAGLRVKYHGENGVLSPHTWLYRLRAMALDDHALPLHEVGRALYHLAQRRGFLSNRKASGSDEDEGEVKSAISELGVRIKESGSRTLGEFFSRINPAEERIRQRWTARAMYEHEFDSIWDSQSRFHPELTPALKKSLHSAMFTQRPLKSQSHLVGKCELVPLRRRAPQASRIAQRFRLVQKVNDLALRNPGELDRPLTEEQRRALIDALDREGDRTFPQIRKLLKPLGVDAKQKFNLEEGGEKKLPGNRTDSKLAPIFGDRWNKLSEAQKDQLVDDLLSIEDEQIVISLGKRKWGLNDEQATRLAAVRLEQDRSRHSRAALRRLLPLMEQGVHYATARKQEFPDSFREHKVYDCLPPVLKAFPELRNPAVCRALTELRKVVNAIIRRYGKPAFVRIELARDLKNPRQVRKSLWEKNRANESQREDAAARILREIPNFGQPRHNDMLKVILADECNWTCPFTGKGINMHSLLGAHPQFDIEHIWPFSQTLDNGFGNKTLCYVDENRHVKGQRTPFDAYAHDEKRWHEILSRVRAFTGPQARWKLARFLADQLPEDFTASQLQDTRYASRLAGDYLSLLYGGRSDESGTLRVTVTPGHITAYLRNEWNLNSILGDGGDKERVNHRHHAVDAIAIAMTSPSTVKRLSDAAGRAKDAVRTLFAKIEKPWPEFLDDALCAVKAVVVSHRVNHKLNGSLHQETNYSKPFTTAQKNKTVERRRVRKPVHLLSAGEIESIADHIVQQRVKLKLAEVGEAKKLENNWPTLPTKNGGLIPIKKVRIEKTISVKPVGPAYSPRYVAPGSNHHTVIIEVKDSKGRVKWIDRPVTLLEAVERRKTGKPIIQREWPEGRFVMWCATGDSLLMQDDSGKEALFILKSVSEGNYELRRHDDARSASDIRAVGKAGGRINLRSTDRFRLLNARKVIVTPLGDIIPCND